MGGFADLLRAGEEGAGEGIPAEESSARKTPGGSDRTPRPGTLGLTPLIVGMSPLSIMEFLKVEGFLDADGNHVADANESLS